MSTVKSNLNQSTSYQIGYDGSDANNFRLYQPAVPDETIRIQNILDGTDLVTIGRGGLTLKATSLELDMTGSAVSAPPLHFTGDTDTGIYRNSGGGIGLTVDGISRFLLGSTYLDLAVPVLSTATQAAATPAYSFLLDSDTGMYRSDINQVSIVGGGVDVAEFRGSDKGSLFHGDILIDDKFVLGDSGSDPGLLQLITGDSPTYAGLQLYFSGTSSWSLKGNETSFGLHDDYNNDWAYLYDENGASHLYYNGVDKLQTHNTGVSITGDVDIDKLVVGAAFSYTATTEENIINLLVGSNGNGAANGIAFYENTGGFGMKFGYDGTGTGDGNKLAWYNDGDTEIMSLDNGGTLRVPNGLIIPVKV